MLTEPPIAMRRSRDITTDTEWCYEQMDRLLGFEILTKAISGNPTPMPPSILADKIGTHKCFPHAILLDIIRKANG